MAVGTVSGLNLDDQWALINTTTQSSGTSLTFSSLGGYKKLMVTFTGFTQSGSGNAVVTLNGSTAYTFGSYIYWLNVLQNTFTGVPLNYTGFAVNANDGWFIVDAATANSPIKKITGQAHDANNTYLGNIDGTCMTTSQVTSLTITSPTAFTAGTFSIYGIAA